MDEKAIEKLILETLQNEVSEKGNDGLPEDDLLRECSFASDLAEEIVSAVLEKMIERDQLTRSDDGIIALI